MTNETESQESRAATTIAQDSIKTSDHDDGPRVKTITQDCLDALQKSDMLAHLVFQKWVKEGKVSIVPGPEPARRPDPTPSPAVRIDFDELTIAVINELQFAESDTPGDVLADRYRAARVYQAAAVRAIREYAESMRQPAAAPMTSTCGCARAPGC